MNVPFSSVLSILQEHGWEMTGIWKPYRVFTKGNELPIMIPVHNKKVDAEYVQRIKEILGLEEESDE